MGSYLLSVLFLFGRYNNHKTNVIKNCRLFLPALFVRRHVLSSYFENLDIWDQSEIMFWPLSNSLFEIS